jgi:hypothetical protein
VQVLRILSRKPTNRQKATEGDVAAIVRHLNGASHKVAAECAKVILNLCFERANVSRLLKCNGVAPLVSLLKSPDIDVQASACGVIQSICYLVRPRPLLAVITCVHAGFPLSCFYAKEAMHSVNTIPILRTRLICCFPFPEKMQISCPGRTALSICVKVLPDSWLDKVILK